MSKGSNRRPQNVDKKTMSDNWDIIFNKKSEGGANERRTRTPECDRRYKQSRAG